MVYHILVLDNGIKIQYSDPREVIYLNKGRTHMKNLLYSKNFISANTFVLDIGANIGQSSLYYARWAKYVHAFEPNPKSFSILAHNIKINCLDNVSYYNIACGNKIGTTDIYCKKDSPTSYIFHKGKKKLNKTCSVQINTLDSFCFNDIGFIKIDIEGYEPFALMGAEKLLAQNCAVWQVEILNSLLKRFDFNAEWIIALFIKYGYTPVTYRKQSFGEIVDERYYHNWYEVVNLRRKKSCGSENLKRRTTDLFFIPNKMISNHLKSEIVTTAEI